MATLPEQSVRVVVHHNLSPRAATTNWHPADAMTPIIDITVTPNTPWLPHSVDELITQLTDHPDVNLARQIATRFAEAFNQGCW